jgi:hypothetical protein
LYCETKMQSPAAFSFNKAAAEFVVEIEALGQASSSDSSQETSRPPS